MAISAACTPESRERLWDFAAVVQAAYDAHCAAYNRGREAVRVGLDKAAHLHLQRPDDCRSTLKPLASVLSTAAFVDDKMTPLNLNSPNWHKEPQGVLAGGRGEGMGMRPERRHSIQGQRQRPGGGGR